MIKIDDEIKILMGIGTGEDDVNGITNASDFGVGGGNGKDDDDDDGDSGAEPRTNSPGFCTKFHDRQ